MFQPVFASLVVSVMLAATAVAGPYEDGSAAYEGGDYAQAAKWWRLAADQGIATAQLNMDLYVNGHGVPVVSVTANAPLLTVAENGKGFPVILVEANAPPFQVEDEEGNPVLFGGGGGEPAAPIDNVAFVGHSLVSADLPAMYERVAGIETVNRQVITGAPLFFSWENHESGGVTGVSVRNLLGSTGVNQLVLTEGGPIEASISSNGTREWLATWRAAGLTQNPDMETFWYQIWPEIVDWATTPNWALWVSEIDRLADEAYNIVAQQVAFDIDPARVYIVPAGEAWAALYREFDDVGLPDVTDFKSTFFPGDKIHIPAVGFYFVSMVHFATLNKQTPVGLPWELTPSVTGLTAALALRLQQIAWDVVSNHPYAGVAEWPEPSTDVVTFVDTIAQATLDAGGPGTIAASLDTGSARAGRYVVATAINVMADFTVSGVTVGGTALTELGVNGTKLAVWGGPIPSDMSGSQSIVANIDTGDRWTSMLLGRMAENVATATAYTATGGDPMSVSGEGGEGFTYVMITGSDLSISPTLPEVSSIPWEHPNNTFADIIHGLGVFNTSVNSDIRSVNHSSRIGVKLSP